MAYVVRWIKIFFFTDTNFFRDNPGKNIFVITFDYDTILK